ncbi:unnamed protein product [Caenorhabditis nigoni]
MTTLPIWCSTVDFRAALVVILNLLTAHQLMSNHQPRRCNNLIHPNPSSLIHPNPSISLQSKPFQSQMSSILS